MDYNLHTYTQVLNLIEVISQSLVQSFNRSTPININTYTLLVQDKRYILEHILKVIKKMYQDSTIELTNVVFSLGIVHQTSNNYINNNPELSNLHFKVSTGVSYDNKEFYDISTGPYIYITIEGDNFYERFYEDLTTEDINYNYFTTAM